MDVLSTPSQAQPAPTASSSSSSSLASDFNTFIQMLTAQAKYQDPLDPIDSSEYAAQLAQFSMVEQQVNTNELMEQMLAVLSTNDMSGAANWIGKEALVQGPAKFDGDPVTIAPNPPIAADEITLIVTNAQGTEVQRLAIPTGAEPFAWDGRKTDGSSFALGEYNFEIESKANGEVLLTEPAMAYSRVTEARIDNGETLLVLDSGYMIAAKNVIGLREPV